jgi:hypothetical protein
MLIGENLGEVKIKVKTWDAYIKEIQPTLALNGLAVTLKFQDPIPTLSPPFPTLTVVIPVKDYTNEELLAVVTEGAEKQYLERCVGRNERNSRYARKYYKLVRLAAKLRKQLGLTT